MDEASAELCHSRGQQYDGKSDMCHRPCETGNTWDAKNRKCIPHPKGK